MNVGNRTRPVSDSTAESLRALLRQVGARKLADTLGVDRSAVERAAAGSPLLQGTRELLEAKLARLGQPQTPVPNWHKSG